MNSFWKQTLSSLTLTAAIGFFGTNGMLMQKCFAQEADGSQEVDEATEATSALPAAEIAFNGPDPNAKGELESPYMHGATDAKSVAIDLVSLLSEEQRGLIVAGEKIPVTGTGIGSVVAIKNNAVQLANQVLSADILQDNRGEIIRFHIWIKGDEVAMTDNLWFDAPTLTFKMFDDNGNQVAYTTSVFKTRGSYPWHNYYVDLELPKSFTLTGKVASNSTGDQLLDLLGIGNNMKANEPGLYLTLSAYGNGTAYFGGLTYERISSKEHKNSSKWLDDAMASHAPNPQYDELPMQLFYGLDTKLPWRFLSGNKAFKSILTNNGLREYIQSVKNDWFQMQKGVAMLPYLYVTANTLNLTDGFEDGWLETLRDQLEMLQDPSTGFWTIDGDPNLFVTAELAKHCFSEKNIAHTDSESVATPWNAAGNAVSLRYAEKIVNSLLGARVSGTPAWNNYALQDSEIGGLQRDTKTELVATSNAVQLLACALNNLTDDVPEYELATNAIKDAYLYGIANFILRGEYLWRENNTAGIPAMSGEGMLELINASKVLEHRVNNELPVPELTCKRQESAGLGRATITWAKPERDLVAVRIYAAPDDVNPNYLNEKHLIGVLERSGNNPKYQDPLMLASRLVNAAKIRWGITPADVDATYVEEKLASVAQYLGGMKRLTAGIAGEKPVTMNVSSPIAFGFADGDEVGTIKIYAAGVNAYGEVTRCISLDAEDEE